MIEAERLVAFVSARLDEDEAAAKAAAEADGADWVLGSTEDDDKRSIRHPTPEWDYYVADRVDEDTAAHIVRHAPARALRDVEAMRKILADRWGGPDHQDMWEHHVRLLAAVWSDHPDYRPEWTP